MTVYDSWLTCSMVKRKKGDFVSVNPELMIAVQFQQL